jgi:hypothetical protein
MRFNREEATIKTWPSKKAHRQPFRQKAIAMLRSFEFGPLTRRYRLNSFNRDEKPAQDRQTREYLIAHNQPCVSQANTAHQRGHEIG